MGKIGVKRIIVVIFFVLNILVALCMLATGFSYLVDPQKIHLAAPLGLFFPAFLLGNFAFLVFWLFVRPVRVWLPLAAFVLCYTPTRMYIGLHPSSKIPDHAVTFMSYNVHDFGGTDTNKLNKDDNQLVHYILRLDTDIACLQECKANKLSDEMYDLLYERYPYHHYSEQGKGLTSLSIYSKYPIQKVDSIPCDTIHSISLAYTLLLPKGSVMIINNHFESNKFSIEKKKDWREMMLGELQKDSVKAESKYIFARFTEMALRRNAQVKAVADYIDMYSDVPMIVCGDLNEIPISYNYQLIAKNFTDCFRDAGWGFGWTYCNHGMRVRIDNILCSTNIEPYKCEVLRDEKCSDHYPIICWMNFKETETTQ